MLFGYFGVVRVGERFSGSSEDTDVFMQDSVVREVLDVFTSKHITASNHS